MEGIRGKYGSIGKKPPVDAPHVLAQREMPSGSLAHELDGRIMKFLSRPSKMTFIGRYGFMPAEQSVWGSFYVLARIHICFTIFLLSVL